MAPFHRVVAYAPPRTTTLGLGIAGAVFRARPELTRFDFLVCGARRGRVDTDLGAPIVVDHGPDAIASADLVLVLPGADYLVPPPERVAAALHAAHRRGAVVAAHCLGVFTLAATGLLDGHPATTHWQHAAELAARHPDIDVRPQELYVDQGSLLTGAGAAAGMDLYLHLVRREHGAATANDLARTLVVPPHRDGGQQQYISAPVAPQGDGERLGETIAWASENLHRPLPVDVLAARALMSRRSFIRHFRAATGTTPHAWLVARRLNLAEELLETTELSVQQVAERVGYSSAAVLREQFTRRRGVPPRRYRRTFGTA